MKWSELPKEYRDLEIPEEAKNDPYDFDSDYLRYKFNWSKSNQGSIFWQECRYAKSIDDLPPIPKPKMTEQFKEAGEKAGTRNTFRDSGYTDNCNHNLGIWDDNDLKKYKASTQPPSYVQYLLEQIAIKDKQLKEDSEFINQQSQQIEQAAIIIGNLKNELSATIVSDAFGNSFVEKNRKIMEPAFYMVFVDGMSSATVKHKTLEDAIKEANRLATNNERVVHVLAHVESYQRKITIEQVK